MIQSIKVNNFKVLKELSVDRLHQVTLISGKNNSGKSTLLEAIFFSNCYFQPNSFLMLNTVRGATSTLMTDVWKSFINVHSSENSFTIKTYGSGEIKKIDVRLENTNNILNNSVNNQVNESDKLNQKTNVKSNITHKLFVVATDGKISDSLCFNVMFNGQIETVNHNSTENTLRNCTFTQYTSCKTGYNQMSLAEMYGKLALDTEEKSKQVIDALKIFDPDIVDLKTIVQHGTVRLYATLIDGHKMPVDYMGDGILKLIYICISILANPNSIMLIDEIENGFHYSMHKKIWEVIFKISKISNVQVIATTHSYECINGASDASNDDIDFGYVRLERTDSTGIIVSKCIDKEQLKSALNSTLEIR